MAIKYGPRKRHNAGTKRTSYNTKTGRTRTTVSVRNKTTGITRSRSVNHNGSIRETTTHKNPAGFVTRTTKTIGTPKISKKAPSFPKPRKSTVSKPKRMSKSGSTGTRRSRNTRSVPFHKFLLTVVFVIIVALLFLD